MFASPPGAWIGSRPRRSQRQRGRISIPDLPLLRASAVLGVLTICLILFFFRQKNGYTIVYPLGTLLRMAIIVKDVGLRLRVEKELRQEFVEACRASGKPAAQVLREFMRDYVTRERVMIQRPLFEETSR